MSGGAGSALWRRARYFRACGHSAFRDTLRTFFASGSDTFRLVPEVLKKNSVSEAGNGQVRLRKAECLHALVGVIGARGYEEVREFSPLFLLEVAVLSALTILRFYLC